MMLLAIFGLILPATFNLADPNAVRVEEVSLVVAIVLLILYFAYIAYSFTAAESDPAIERELHVADTETHDEGHTPWSRRTTLIVLAGATIATVLLSETLVGEIESVIAEFGVSEFFIGAIVVPLVGNVAEHFSGITLAGKNKMDIALGIAAGSSTQVALLVAPLLVLLSLVIGPQPFNLATGMNLVFIPMEIVAITAAGFLFNYISHDGETNWLEGLQLVALYIILAAIFFLIHIPETGAPH
jgi:Ca2+:H+ antiporter